MPRTKPALSENKAPGVRQEPSSPRAEHRKSEKGSKPPGSAATRPQHRQRQLCKRCGASARRKSCAQSCLVSTNLIRSGSEGFCRHRFGLLLLAELLEARILTQRIPERIKLEIGYGDTGGHFEKMR